ncbi:MAG TPA: PmoA family protein [Chloroflexota bacterium]|nr:PmoA family protein [Chloroflexota bacterium]
MSQPAPSLRLTHHFHDRLEVHYGPVELFRYVYRPQTEARESPKPYLHPIRTLAGNEVTIYRPHDHVWHHGLAMTQAVLSGQNFWGGPSYVRDRGYAQLPNNGRIEHTAWTDLACESGRLQLEEELSWISYEGEPWLAEQRRLEVSDLDPQQGYWGLGFASTLRNVRREPLVFGSPTTQGRELAGYGGLFWRGPRSFLKGKILAGGGLHGPQVMGQAAPWLAYVGRHDGSAATSTVLFVDQPQSVRYPTKWFVRDDPYAAVSFAFCFDEELTLEPGATLSLSHRLIFADGEWSRERIEALLQA